MFKLITNIIPSPVLRFLKDYIKNYHTLSYSQEGEDMILKRLFETQEKKGFYVDVGAHHPKRFSNTYYFYKKGWSGINIDAMPNSMNIFNRLRKRDINIEVPISATNQILKYYVFNETAFNGFSKKLSEKRDGLDHAYGKYFIRYTKEIETRTLRDVLTQHLSVNQEIDFLSIDVEGLDFEVLKSNDFEKFRPKVILIEILGKNINDVYNSETTKFLKKHKYILYAKSVKTVFFMCSRYYDKRSDLTDY